MISKLQNILSFVLVFLFLLGVALLGCKGKVEEKPVVIASPPAEQQAQVTTTTTKGTTEETEAPSKVTPNRPPRITIFNVHPPLPVVGSNLRAEVAAVDKEGDDIAINYQWKKNNELLLNTSDTLELTSEEFKRGDKIAVRAMPEAAGQKGAPLVVVLTIANAPPIIKSSPESFRFDGRVYTDQVKASDPDGDQLVYSIKSGPEGATIDPATGRISWDVPDDFKGKTSIAAAVNDGQGGEATQIFNVEITSK